MAKNLKLVIARDEKYLKFLMDIYLKTNSGYTSLSLSALILSHKVNKNSSLALQELGWLKKSGATVGVMYHWKGDAPTRAMAETFQEKLLKMKAVVFANKKAFSIPVNKNGTPLVPVVKTDNPKRVSLGASERYSNFLKHLFAKTVSQPSFINLSDECKAFKISKGAAGIVKDLGFIKRHSLNIYQWVGAPPDEQTVADVLAELNKRVNSGNKKNKKNKTVETPEVKTEEWNGIPERFRHLVAAEVKGTPEVKPEPIKIHKVTFSPNVQADDFHKKNKQRQEFLDRVLPGSPATLPQDVKDIIAKHTAISDKNELKKSIALKLIDLGEYERADKLLAEILE